jgi:hypothetical protein
VSTTLLVVNVLNSAFGLFAPTSESEAGVEKRNTIGSQCGARQNATASSSYHKKWRQTRLASVSIIEAFQSEAVITIAEETANRYPFCYGGYPQSYLQCPAAISLH